MMHIPRKIGLGICLFFILAGPIVSENKSGPCFYVMRYGTFDNSKAFLDTYDLIKNKVISSKKIDSRISGMLLNDKGNLLFLYRETPFETKPLHEIHEYDIKTKKSRLYIKNRSLDPEAAFSTKSNLYFLFENIIISDEDIKKNPHL